MFQPGGNKPVYQVYPAARQHEFVMVCSGHQFVARGDYGASKEQLLAELERMVKEQFGYAP